MKKYIFIVSWCLIISVFETYGKSDSPIDSSDLVYHSEFEKIAVQQFLEEKMSAFNLFLAADESVSRQVAEEFYTKYSGLFEEFETNKVPSKNLEKSIRVIRQIVEPRFFSIYDSKKLFSQLLGQGHYNSLTATMFYAFVFNELGIPYKLMAYENDAYLIAYPGPFSIVVENINHSNDAADYSGKQIEKKVESLIESGEVDKSALLNHSADEIFIAWQKNASEVSLKFLVSLQYYRLAKEKLEMSEFENAYALAGKSNFFYPTEKAERIISDALVVIIDRSDFQNVADIDKVAEFSKLKTSDLQIVSEVFQRIVKKQLDQNREREYCDSLYSRLIMKVDDQVLDEEISFRYNLLMSFRYKEKPEAEPYLLRALSIRPEHNDLNQLMKTHFYNYFRQLYETPVLLFSEVARVKNEVSYEGITDILSYFESLASLQMADASIKNGKAAETEMYLEIFENGWNEDQHDEIINDLVVKAYRSLAVHYYYKGNKNKARETVDRGLVYAPGNSYLKSAVY